MVLNSFEDLIKKVKSSGITKKIVVIAADDAHTLEAVMAAQKDGIVNPVFIGDAAAIYETLDGIGVSRDIYEV